MRQPWRFSTALALTALLALVVTAPLAHAAAGGGWLGVAMQPMSDALREGLSYTGDGVLVSGVEPDSPADRAGVRKGDVITSFNSRSVTGTEMLTDLVGNSEPGKTVSIGLWRHGTRQTLSAKLGTRPADGGMRIGSGDADTFGAPVPPRAPEAPMPPEAPHMMWMERDLKGLPEMRHSLGALSMSGIGRGRLGVQVQGLDSQLGEYFGVPDGKGVLVSSVTEDTPASRAGFKAGDVIVKVGDREVEDSDALRTALRDRPAGKVDVTVLRKGQRMTLSPVLEEPRSEGSFKMPGDGWKQAGPGEWHFEGPNGQKRIVIRRSGDDDGDVHIEGPGGGRRIVIQHDSGDDEDRAEMQRQIEELQKQVEQLKQQMATPAPKPAPKTTTTKK